MLYKWPEVGKCQYSSVADWCHNAWSFSGMGLIDDVSNNGLGAPSGMGEELCHFCIVLV